MIKNISPGLIENVKDLKISLNKLTVQDLSVYSMLEIYYKVANKLNEVITELSRFEGVLSEEVVKQNEKLIYLLGEGLENEVIKEINNLINKGFFEELLNESLFSELNRQLDLKASLSELIVERKRIDNLTSLQEGSTTGDAELIDARIDVFGNTNTTTGTSVRNQVRNITGDIISTKTFSFQKSTFKGQIISTELNSFKNQPLQVKLTCNGNVISSGTELGVGVLDLNNNQINNIGVLKPNENVIVYPPCDVKEVRVWIGSILNDGDITITVTSLGAFNSIKSLSNICNKNTDCSNILINKLFGEVPIDSLYKNEGKTTINNTNAGISIECKGSFKKGEKLYIQIKSNCLKYNIPMYGAVEYPTGEVTSVFTIYSNLKSVFTPTEECTNIRVWVPSTNILTTGSVSLIVANYDTTNLTDSLKNNNNITFSIIGDSYSTYNKWIPEGYSTWYSDNGNSQENNVGSVKDTWWWKLSNECKMSLITNSSFSGSTICNTGYNNMDNTNHSFVSRIKKDIGENKTTQIKPNIIFIFGGTNDTWANSPIGTLKYSNWVSDDLKQVLPSFCYMIDYLKTYNPHSRIINIVNTDLTAAIKEGMKNACDYYGIENLILQNIEKENNHPNKNGMESIKNQIISIL